MAFVVVQHLPPERESLMAEILARHAHIPVRQIEDGLAVEPNHAYVIRPGFTVTLRDGVFRLGEPVEKRGHRRPVDDFFRSLAEEQKDKAIAIVLSGMGTNGTAGAQAIKAAGGLCIAQAPESAEFVAMPSSLIHAGYADRILRPAEMPALLAQYVQHPYIDPEGKGAAQAREVLQSDRQRLTQIFAILRIGTGHDFSGYKKPTVLRRIQRRMGLAGTEDLASYAEHLQQNSEEALALANDLMINVTGFFRDPEAWEALREAVVRPLIADWKGDEPLRAWATACASGEEAYTLAILIAEEIERAGKRIEVKIFATDTADKSLALARAGVYPGGIEGDLSVDRIDRFFDKDEHTYRIKKHVREMVVFAPHDVLRDPPFSKISIGTCRNLLIYLEPKTQDRVLALLHFAIRESGYLFLGGAETLGTAKHLFDVLSVKHRIYRRIGAETFRYAPVSMLSAAGASHLRRTEILVPRPSMSFALQQALFEQFGPPTVIVDKDDRIVFFHGNTAPFLMQPLGEPTHDLFEMLSAGLRVPVRAALRRVATVHEPAAVKDAEIATSDGPLRVDITVAPLFPTHDPQYFRVSFETDSGEQQPLIDGAESKALHRRPLRSEEPVLEDELFELQECRPSCGTIGALWQCSPKEPRHHPARQSRRVRDGAS